MNMASDTPAVCSITEFMISNQPAIAMAILTKKGSGSKIEPFRRPVMPPAPRPGSLNTQNALIPPVTTPNLLPPPLPIVPPQSVSLSSMSPHGRPAPVRGGGPPSPLPPRFLPSASSSSSDGDVNVRDLQRRLDEEIAKREELERRVDALERLIRTKLP